ncbi:hypothetical protein [Nitrosopumilus sp.]|uniref:hypothetical protein n=1 Tax=Nitrosopumilus sp. TaxID=2024843 RepID=UPI003B5C8F71
MRKLGTVDLEILHLAIKENGTFDENNLENSNLKRLGVGRLLDALASLKDRKLISLNTNGSFSITEIGRETLWSENIPKWAKILRLLQVRSCNTNEIADFLREKEENLTEDIEKLRKNQFILMSAQRQEEKIIKVYEILPEGIEKIDSTETLGFENNEISNPTVDTEVFSIINEIIKEIQDSQIEESSKNEIVKKVFKLKEKLRI